jgi:hypothetical protein
MHIYHTRSAQTCCRLENENKPRIERGKSVVDSTGDQLAQRVKQDSSNVVADDLSTEKERTLGFLKRVVGADGSVKLDKDKVVRKLKGNADAARHKEKLGGIAKKMAAGASAHVARFLMLSSALCPQTTRRSRTKTMVMLMEA